MPPDEELRADLASTTAASKGAGLVGFNDTLAYSSPTVGSYLRRLYLDAKVHDASYYGSGSSGLLNMLSALGRIEIAGPYELNDANVTVTGPIAFRPGGYLQIGTGRTLTIRGPIEAGSEHIFRGSGSVVLGGTDGEPAREVHAAWFGAFPTSSFSSDMALGIGRANAAIGNSREGIIHFDIGNYWLESNVALNRAVWLKGAAIRQTVFKVRSDGFIPFTSNNVLPRISGANFELDYASLTTRASQFVLFTHDQCRVEDVRCGESKIAIDLAGQSCAATRIRGVYGAYPGAGSSLVRIRGNRSVAEDIATDTSVAFGPDQLVDIGGGATGNIDRPQTYQVSAIGPSKTVRVIAEGGNVTNPFIDGTNNAASSGSLPACDIHLLTTGSHSITRPRIINFNSSPALGGGILLESNSSGRIEHVLIDDGIVPGATGYGVHFLRTTGGIEDVRIGSTVDVTERAEPIKYTGTGINRVAVSPAVEPGVRPALTKFLGVADDAYTDFLVNRSIFSAGLQVAAGTTNNFEYVNCVVRLHTTSLFATIASSANVVMTTTELDQTTATDGRLTVCVLNKRVRVINRLGQSRNCSITLMAGE